MGGASVTGSNNLIDATTVGLTKGVNGNIIGVNALLGSLQDNGGPTPTVALLPGSPAIGSVASIALSSISSGVDAATTQFARDKYHLVRLCPGHAPEY